jgi:amicyanin
MHHNRTALVCAAIATSVAACTAPANGPAPTVSATTSTVPAPPVAGTAVNITNFAFTPAALTVKVGDTVTWTNKDEEPHTIVAGDGSFRSPGLDTNAAYSYTFTKPGNFDYICSIHPFMHGTVAVS